MKFNSLEVEKTFEEKLKDMTLVEVRDKKADSNTRIKENEKAIRALQKQIAYHVDVIRSEEKKIEAYNERLGFGNKGSLI